MKKTVFLPIVCLFFVLLSCNNKGQKASETVINYRGTMAKDSTIVSIEFTITGISKPSTIKGSYLYTKYNQPTELTGGIINNVLTLSEKETEKEGTFIFNNFDVEKDEITGVWINSNDSADIYNVKLTKFIPLASGEIQENSNLIPIPVNELRKFIGFINQGYHPDLIEFIKYLKKDLKDNDKLSKQLDNYLEGGFGSGFLYVDTDGKNYIITNHHVISQSYTPSITFENQDGTKTKYSDLQIVMSDDELDLALLTFPNDQRPFNNGIQIYDTPLDDGYEIFAAGYPGLGHKPLWQFGKGIVSNSSAYLPKNDDWEDTKGPYIQHTAEVDPGNSGGPLLIDTSQSREYIVAGVNTLKAENRQAANYAIPANKLSDFIERALGKANINAQEELKERVNSFVENIKNFGGDNYEYVLNYFSDNFAHRFVRAAINKDYNDPIIKILDAEEQGLTMALLSLMGTLTDPLDGIKATLLISFYYGSTGDIDLENADIAIKTVDSNIAGRYTVSLTINEEPVITEWVKEYGIWRLDNFKTEEHGNDVMKRAKKTAIGSTVSGNLDSKSKWYKVDISSGCWLNVYTEGNSDTQITLYNSEGVRIAADDDSGSGYNASVTIGVTEGTVFIEVSGYNRANDSFRLATKTVTGNFQNRYMEQALYIAPGIRITSSFQYGTDAKWYKIDVPSNTRGLTVYTEGRMDTKISLYNGQGRILAEDDDSGDDYNARISVTVQGTMYIKVENLDRSTGEFRLLTSLRR